MLSYTWPWDEIHRKIWWRDLQPCEPKLNWLRIPLIVYMCFAIFRFNGKRWKTCEWERQPEWGRWWHIPVKAECDFVTGYTYECCFGDDPVAPWQHPHQQQRSMQLAHWLVVVTGFNLMKLFWKFPQKNCNISMKKSFLKSPPRIFWEDLGRFLSFFFFWNCYT